MQKGTPHHRDIILTKYILELTRDILFSLLSKTLNNNVINNIHNVIIQLLDVDLQVFSDRSGLHQLRAPGLDQDISKSFLMVLFSCDNSVANKTPTDKTDQGRGLTMDPSHFQLRQTGGQRPAADLLQLI